MIDAGTAIGPQFWPFGGYNHQYIDGSWHVTIAQTPRIAHTPSMLYTWGYQTLDFTFNWEDQQGYLGNINSPTPVKLLHSLTIFNKGFNSPTPAPLTATFIEDLQ